MAKKKEVSTLEDVIEGKVIEEEEINQEESTDGEVVKIKYIGSNPTFTIGKIIFMPGNIKELPKDLAILALKNKGFQQVK